MNNFTISPPIKVEIVAKVARAETPIVSCSQSDAELQISKIYTISRALPLLPFQVCINIDFCSFYTLFFFKSLKKKTLNPV